MNSEMEERGIKTRHDGWGTNGKREMLAKVENGRTKILIKSTGLI